VDIRERRLALGATLALLASCTGAHADPSPSATAPIASPTAAPPKIAYLQDETIDEPLQHELPALQGLRLALEGAADGGSLPAPVEITDLDTHGEPSTALELAREVAADPAYVAVVVAPHLDEPEAVGRTLDDAGLATIGLSTLGPPGEAWGGRLRLVPRQTVQVRALAGYLRARATPPVCLVGEGSASADPLATALANALGSRVVQEDTVPSGGIVPESVTAHLRDAGCATVAWAGSSTGAAALRVALTGAGLGDVPLVGSDLVKTDTYLTTTGRAGEGTVVSCPCADLFTSTALRAQVFVHDYQSEFGTPPAPFAAEGWDAGEILVRALAGGADRASVRATTEGLDRYGGLAGTYVVGADGELAPGTAHVGFWVDRGQRWATPRWEEPRSG